MSDYTPTPIWIKEKFKNEKPLTNHEEWELFQRIREGSYFAKAMLLQANMKFVIQVASKYHNDSLDQEELIDEGAIGLWRAIESFDHTRGVRFITYAVWWIKAYIARAISEKGSLIRLPLNQQIRIHKELRKASKNKDLPEEILQLSTLSKTQVSLDAPIGGDGVLKMEDILVDNKTPSTEQKTERKLIAKFAHKLFNKVPERERNVLKLMGGTNGEPLSIREISRKMNLSRERVRQIKDQAMARIRNLNYDGHLDPVLQEIGCK